MLVPGVLTAMVLLLPRANPGGKQVEGSAMVEVAHDATIIKADSLMHHGARAATRDALLEGAENDLKDIPNGRSLYRFRLNPGERLALTLQTKDSGRMFMGFVPPAVRDEMDAQYHRANGTPRPVREKSIEIQNVQEAPADVMLALYGPVNVPFVVEIERK